MYELSPVEVSVNSARGVAKKLAAAINPQNLVIIPKINCHFLRTYIFLKPLNISLLTKTNPVGIFKSSWTAEVCLMTSFQIIAVAIDVSAHAQ